MKTKIIYHDINIIYIRYFVYFRLKWKELRLKGKSFKSKQEPLYAIFSESLKNNFKIWH